MPSNSLHKWMTVRKIALDEVENAHRSVGGSGPGRRYATQQINQAYAVLLSSQFQGFCRDLHDECADYLIAVINPVSLKTIMRDAFVVHRKLDTGNPNPGNIGADFYRFGLDFWDEVRSQDARNESRQAALEELNRWRNAIAHQHFDPAILGSTNLRIKQVRVWRQACHGLAGSFDIVMRNYIYAVGGIAPW